MTEKLSEVEFIRLVTRRRQTAREFNERFPSGTPCRLILDDRSVIETQTRGVAWDVGKGLHRHPIVCVQGRNGGYDINRIVERVPARADSFPPI